MHKLLPGALALMMTVLSASAQNTGTTAPTVEELVARRVARLTTLLTLTAAQQTQATSIFTTEENALAAVRTSLNTARTSLTTAIQKNDAASITTLSTQIGTLTAQQVRADATADAAFYALLTTDQQARYNELKLPGLGGPGGPGGHGGPGGGGPGAPPPPR